MTISDLLDKAASELTEELIEVSRNPTGEPWFFVIRRKMEALAKALKQRRKK